jgi:molecular chaperone HscB
MWPVRAKVCTRYSLADRRTGKISATLENIEHAVHRESWDEAHREAVRLKFLRGIEAAAQSWPNAPPGNH